MTDKRTSKASKFKNFLVTGSVDEKEDDTIEEDTYQDDQAAAVTEEEFEGSPKEEVIVEDIIIEEVRDEEEFEPCQAAVTEEDRTALENEIAELKKMVADLTAGLERYATSKEQLKEYSAVISKRDGELANRKFIGMLEQLSVMREDFFKLCGGINAKLDSFSPKEILGSFEAYGVDMENILMDCGVEIGQSKFEKLNTIHQRIVDIIPTDDESKNGMIAERVSDGYTYQGRVLLKEKVKIYRFSEKGKTEGDEEK